MLLIAAAFLTWTVGYCYMFGYGPHADTAPVLGLPGWVVWGIALPWCIATVVSVVFALVVIRDDALDAASEPLEEEDDRA